MSKKPILGPGTVTTWCENPLKTDNARYKAGQACSLWEVIQEKACGECSPLLQDLLSLACDLNQGIYRDLSPQSEQDVQHV